MNICGIVCEYNPFHNGHMHQIAETRKNGVDAIVCVMSGNFVQRGDFAIMRKSARAEVAILCGADVVIELPVPYVLSSAERFAFGAVSILERLGCVSKISFGAEDCDVSKLYEIAKLLLSGALDSDIAVECSTGISYAAARERALAKVNPLFAEFIKKPNNILAIEYIKALLKINSEIEPIAIVREGVSHDEQAVSESFSSASNIRRLIFENSDFKKLLPEKSFEILVREISGGYAPNCKEKASNAIMSVLKRLSADDFLKYSDVSEGLENRLFDAVSKSSDIDEVISNVKTKRYPHSRISRILLNAFLGIESDYCESSPPYARVLAFNETGREILKAAKKTSSIPIITKPASIKSESEEAKRLLALEGRVDDIYSLFTNGEREQGLTFTTSPIILSDK